MTTAEDLIKGALRRINSYAPGEPLAAFDANDALETLNDLLDSWSTDEYMVYGSVENIFYYTAGQYIYTIGPGGDFDTKRPLRITNAFTRITTQASGLDYPIDIIDQDTYTRIGFKGIAAPWPIKLWYNPTWPLGTISFYQNPSDAAELHLFTDTILADLTLTDEFDVPQGYARAIKFNLARELCLEYGLQISPTLEKLASESLSVVKALNAQPVPLTRLDQEMISGNRTDAGWILSGGFNRGN